MQGVLPVQQQEGLPGAEARGAVPQRRQHADRHLRERPQPRAAAGPLGAYRDRGRSPRGSEPVFLVMSDEL